MIKEYLYYLWHKHIEPYDPFALQLKQALKSALALVISIAIFAYFKLPQPQWLVFCTVFVMQMNLGENRNSQFFTQLIGGLILAVGIFAGSLFGHSFVLFLLAMGGCTFITFYLSKYGRNIYTPAIFILVMILMAGSFPVDLSNALLRLMNAGIGLALALAVNHLVWPFNPYKLLQKNLAKGFSNISNYVKFVIDDSLRGNFHRLQRYERKAKVLKSIENCRSLAKNYHEKIELQKTLPQQERLFIQVIALGDLLNKPNSEYTLDRILTELNKLNPILVETIYHANRENLINLKNSISELTNTTNNPDYQIFITHDINNIIYILTNIHTTLSNIYANRINQHPQ